MMVVVAVIGSLKVEDLQKQPILYTVFLAIVDPGSGVLVKHVAQGQAGFELMRLGANCGYITHIILLVNCLGHLS